MNINILITVAILLIIANFAWISIWSFTNLKDSYVSIAVVGLIGSAALLIFSVTWDAPKVSTKKFSVEVEEYLQGNQYFYTENGTQKRVFFPEYRETDEKPYVVIDRYETDGFYKEKVILYANQH